MNTFYPTKEYVISTLFTLLLSLTSIAQVGIGNTSPNANALLDIGTDSSTAGLRLPRVALTGTANFAPLSAHVQGMTVYNTAVISDVIEGYYYNDGTKWVLIASEDWKLLGNAGTSQTQNFVGTTDNVGLTFRTNNLQRFRINTNNQLLALENGSAAAPSYSWGNDTSMGFYKSGNRQMDMVINGTSFYNANRVGSSNFEWTFNPGGVDLNLRVETDSEANALFVDGLNDNIGFGTNSPNLSSQLEMTAINKGLLINRVILSATNNASPITSPATGLLIYNTATASTGSTAVTPGFYYWDGSKWVAMGGTNGNDWSLLGNAGTSVGTNFIGTTDNQDVVIRANNIERVRVGTTETVVNEDSNSYNFRVESNNQPNMLFVNAGTDRIGIQTATPANVFHVSNNGINIGATSLSYFENNGTNGVSLLGLNNGTTNGYNGLEAGTRGTSSGVFGLGVSVDTGSAYDANGVYGHANDLQGIGVYGVRATTGGGPDIGFGGLFLNDLGFTGGLFNVSDIRLKKEIKVLNKSIEIIKQLNPVTYYYDLKKYPFLGLNKQMEYGFIAQELEEILPQLVKEKYLDTNATNKKSLNSDNSSQKKELFKMVDYTRIIPILTGAIQEQQIIIEKQNSRITELENAIREINKKLK